MTNPVPTPAQALRFIADWAHDCIEDANGEKADFYGFADIERRARAALASQPAADLEVHINDGGAHDRAMAWSEGYGEGFEAAEALVKMPQGMYEASRYDTDTTHVLHLWPSPDGGESVDLIVPIDAAIRGRQDAMTP